MNCPSSVAVGGGGKDGVEGGEVMEMVDGGGVGWGDVVLVMHRIQGEDELPVLSGCGGGGG